MLDLREDFPINTISQTPIRSKDLENATLLIVGDEIELHIIFSKLRCLSRRVNCLRDSAEIWVYTLLIQIFMNVRNPGEDSAIFCIEQQRVRKFVDHIWLSNSPLVTVGDDVKMHNSPQMLMYYFMFCVVWKASCNFQVLSCLWLK